MKGVVLAGGTGSRLYPLTRITNKHLLPVYNKPMIYYPIDFLVESGVTDIMLVCGGNSAGDFLRLLGNGEQFGLKRLHYAYQSEPKGIADALSLAEEFIDGDPMCVILGDNIFEMRYKFAIEKFMKEPNGAMIFGTKVKHPEHYGVVEVGEDGKVKKIVEKPSEPTSDIIATGMYVYDKMVWDFLKKLSPSERGELEITDINNMYVEQGKMQLVQLIGWWADCGENFDSLLDAGNKVRISQQARQRPLRH
jgi:glucose-1-phosphate thymidylyltransferase